MSVRLGAHRLYVDKMCIRNFKVGMLYLFVFTISVSIGFEVIYRMSSPNCGGGDSVKMLGSTIDLSLYGLTLGNNSSFLFSVKSEQDMAIFATDTKNSLTAERFYLLYIGGSGNIWCRIVETRSGFETERKRVQGSFANNTFYVPFWYSWKGGEIQAGLGETIGVNTFIAWNDLNPINVQGIGIATCWGATGEWKIKIEVQDTFGGHFSKCRKSNTRSELTIMGDFTTSRISCAGKCATNDNCFGFNYHLSNRCELLSVGILPLVNIVTNSVKGWDFYVKCYDGKGVCVGCYF